MVQLFDTYSENVLHDENATSYIESIMQFN